MTIIRAAVIIVLLGALVALPLPARVEGWTRYVIVMLLTRP